LVKIRLCSVAGRSITSATVGVRLDANRGMHRRPPPAGLEINASAWEHERAARPLVCGIRCDG
jgi:hypothetical protein